MHRLFACIKKIVTITFMAICAIASIVAILLLFEVLSEILREVGIIDTNYESYGFDDLIKYFRRTE